MLVIVVFLLCFIVISNCFINQTVLAADENPLIAPILSTVPRLDEYVTNSRPLFAWPNTEGGYGIREYILQIDTSPTFDSLNLLEYQGITEGVRVTSWRVKEGNELKDNTQYFWRVMAVDSKGNKSPWGTEIGGITARFLVNTSWNDSFYGTRVPAIKIHASNGFGIENIQDYDESGFSFWEGMENQENYWIEFDLGEPIKISRIWQLVGKAGWKPRVQSGFTFVSQQSDLNGRLSDYEWQYSNDGQKWQTILQTKTSGANGFKGEFVLDNYPVTARYFRLFIKGWIGNAPRVHEVTFYTAGQPSIPQVPDTDYVLVICNRRSDTKNTSFRDVVLGLNGHVALPWDLKVVEVAAYNISLEILKKLKNKPVAIFLTGFDRWGEMLPQFEFNGEYEIIRMSDIPILGACGGHQLMAQQEDFTFARDTGRCYGTESIESILKEDIPPIKIEKNDPIFDGMVNPFYGPEYHSWTISVIPEGFEVLATSKDANGFICNELIKAKNRLVYGTQFHSEVAHPWNASKMILINFLRMAMARKSKLESE